MNLTTQLNLSRTLTGLTGGGTNLDGVATADLANGFLVMVHVSGFIHLYRIRAGTDAESSPTIIRPDDYAATTNERVWELMGIICTGIKVGANQVVGARRTGWTAATGTPTRTAFATSTATTQDVAERLKALIDDLLAHGLIGA